MKKQAEARVTLPKFTFDVHAVERILKRRLPLRAVLNVARYGISVQENQFRKIVRGTWGEQPLHVVVLKDTNVIKTVYVADEWTFEVQTERQKPYHNLVSATP